MSKIGDTEVWQVERMVLSHLLRGKCETFALSKE